MATSLAPAKTGHIAISGLQVSTSLLVAGITFAGFLLRVIALDNDSLWFDTAHSGVVALNPTLGDVIRGAATDYQSPLYFALLHYWLQLSTSDFWLRMLTALVGTAIIPLCYVTGKRFFSTQAGLVAALFCAITSYQVYFSRYPRGYILVAFLALAAAYSIHRACDEHDWRWWLLHGVCVVVALYTHPYTFFLLPALWGYGLWRAFRQPNLILPLFATTGAALVAYIPWLGVSWGQWGQVQAGADAWIEPASRDALKTLYDWLWFKTRSEYGLMLDLLLKGGRYAFSALLLWSLWHNCRSRERLLSVGAGAPTFDQALSQKSLNPRRRPSPDPFLAQEGETIESGGHPQTPGPSARLRTGAGTRPLGHSPFEAKPYDGERRYLWFVVALGVGTAAVVFAFSALLQPLWDPRYLVILSPFLALWLGRSIADLLESPGVRMHIAGIGAVALMVAMASPPIVSMYTDKAFFAPDIRGSAAWVRSQYKTGDLILHINYQSYLPALWYDQQTAHKGGVSTVAFSVPCIWESLPDDWCSQAPYPESYVNLDLQSSPEAIQGQHHVWLVVLYNHNKVGEQEKTDALVASLAKPAYGVAHKEMFLGVNVFELKPTQFSVRPMRESPRIMVAR